MSYTIGSFNLNGLDFTSVDEKKKNFMKLTRIIHDENFDVIALQEVMSKNAVEHLVNFLGPNWGFNFKLDASKASKYTEGYAFIWNKRRLNMIDDQSFTQLTNRYEIKPDSRNNFIHEGHLTRPPFVVRLTPQGLPGGTNFEIRLINTHIAFYSPTICIDKYSDVELRKMELQILAEKIYRYVSDKRYGTNLPAYTILLGDYNLCLVSDDASTVIEECIDITPIRKLHTVQRDKTTLRLKPKDTDLYSQNYDHFSYDKILDDKMTLTASRVDALDKYYKTDLESLENYRNEISDHVPIKLTLNLKTKQG